jgi:hypothetical protein
MYCTDTVTTCGTCCTCMYIICIYASHTCMYMYFTYSTYMCTCTMYVPVVCSIFNLNHTDHSMDRSLRRPPAAIQVLVQLPLSLARLNRSYIQAIHAVS